jgi:hypothetical protein
MSAYLRAPGVEPIRIQTYPKRHRGFVADARIASLATSRPVTALPLGRFEDPCYADFLVDTESQLQVTA